MQDINESHISNTDNPLIQERLAKLQACKDKGFKYPNKLTLTHTANDLHLNFSEHSKKELEDQEIQVAIAGRVTAKRRQGKVIFMDLLSNGERIQLFISKNAVGEIVFEELKTWDMGDIAYFSGHLFRTMKAELSVMVKNVELLTKSLRPLPEKHHGLKDTETCYRQRYLDLMTNKESRERFIKRTKTIKVIRNYLDQRSFLEVDTNILQSIPSGANAKKFDTHMDSLGIDLSLRVAPELPLKRLVVGGFERVYEIGKNFRNEGLSTRHNPEFTMIEFYEAFSDYLQLMNRTEEMLKLVAIEVNGNSVVEYGEHSIDFGNFRRMTVLEAIVEHEP
jgi:lysyl-tRNA synthetase class 2